MRCHQGIKTKTLWFSVSSVVKNQHIILISKSADPMISSYLQNLPLMPMKQLYILLIFVLLSISSFGQTLDPLWLKQIASAQSGGGISFDESVDLIETDSEGNVYVAGFVQNAAIFDTSTL
jgi:hypothetical protein